MVKPSIINIEGSQEDVPQGKSPPYIVELNVPIEFINSGFQTTHEHGRRIFKRDSTSTDRTELEKITLEINVPPGTLSGTRLVFSGEGDQTTANEPGDVVVIIRDAPHRHFVRDKANLKFTVKTTVKEAHQGTIVSIPTLDGPILYNVFNPKPMEVIRGKGLPVTGDATRRGDLCVFFEYHREERTAPVSYLKWDPTTKSYS